MAFTYHDLKGKTVQELREIAKETNHESLQGAMQMNKEHLLPVLCKALGIEAHEHHDAVGINKPAIKAKMRELKKKKLAALGAHDHAAIKSLRRHIHSLNRQIRAHLN
jgi:DNA-binding IclR family transcriptional regulator